MQPNIMGTLGQLLAAAAAGPLAMKGHVYVPVEESPLTLESKVCLVAPSAAMWMSDDPAEPHMIAQAQGFGDIGISTQLIEGIAGNARQYRNPPDAALLLKGLQHWIEYDAFPSPVDFAAMG